MSQSSLKNNKLGLRMLENPYLQPKKTLGMTPEEFVVFKLEIDTPTPSRITWSADIIDSNGKAVADYKDLKKLTFFWEDFPGLDDDAVNRSSVLSHTYIPSQSFISYKGHKEYYIVCFGKYPLPRPYSVTATVSIDDQVADTLSIDVIEPPEGTKKK